MRSLGLDIVQHVCMDGDLGGRLAIGSQNTGQCSVKFQLSGLLVGRKKLRTGGGCE